MRIIHTSDWHLGQNFARSKSRAAEHSAFLSWLLDQIEKNKVDALIVAGDIFDTGSPPSYAREMYNRFIVDIQKTSCELVVLGGNHDSVATLNESKDLLACLNTYVVSSVLENAQEQIISLKDRQGNIGAILCAIPFVRPRDVMFSQAGQSGREKQQAMQLAITEHYHELYQRAVVKRDKYKKKTKKQLPIICTGHLTTVGATTTDSVREIYIGSLDAFPASGFPPADYIALGHIHQSQKVAKSEYIRYSGSPIPLSFDESGKKAKSVLLVDFKGGKFKSATPIEIPCFQAMHIIKGDIASIEKQLSKVTTLYKLEKEETLWVEIQVSSQEFIHDLQARIQQIIKDLPIEVLIFGRKRIVTTSLQKQEKETLDELTVMDVFERRLKENSPDEDKQQKKKNQRLKVLYKQVVDEITTEREADAP